MAKSDLRIDILGTVFTISTDEDPEYLNMLLDKYRRTIENVQRVSGLKDPLKTAILTGFLLCDDLEKAGGGESPAQSSGEEGGEAEKLTLGMISRLDEALMAPDAPREEGDTIPEAAIQEAGAGIFRLKNPVKNYDWGSPEWIPALVGERNLSRIPWAELWMGVNPSGPSRVISGEDESGKVQDAPLLSELIDRKKETFLGKGIAGTYGTLPFLFKVLAAARPLSIQVHPNQKQAREGFHRENRAGIPLDAPNRNYKNPTHKPEIICALSPFAALCGFRTVPEIIDLFEILSRRSGGPLKAGLENLVSALKRENENPYKAFLTALFGLGREERAALGPFIRTHVSPLERDFPGYRDEWELCSYLAGLYPGDPGIIAPLYLNIVELAEGEAMYLPAGVFHSYIHGMGIELMADSDNVLRGGLTPKYVDPRELLEILTFSAYRPEILKAPSPPPPWFSYPSPAEEFALSVISCSGSSVPYPETGPSIVIVTQGDAAISEPGSGNEITISKGESVFISAGKNRNLVFSGTFTAYAAAAGRITGEQIPARQMP